MRSHSRFELQAHAAQAVRPAVRVHEKKGGKHALHLYMPCIFGYDSLIEQSSRLRTPPRAIHVLPDKVPGFARGWWARTGSVGFSTTFAGAIPDPSTFMSGAVYAVSHQELDDTNKPESQSALAEPHRPRHFLLDLHSPHQADLLRRSAPTKPIPETTFSLPATAQICRELSRWLLE
jgi:hypothetical protein